MDDPISVKAKSSLNKITIIWLFVAIPIIGALIFRSSFNLGLYGDDWQHLYNLWRDFYIYQTKSFFDIRSYLNPYWPNYLYLGIINHFWGFYAPAYFIASFILRMFANIALYFFAFELTKSKSAAVLTTLIFLFSSAGLQTTDWVFNMNTYAGLGVLSIASVFYLKIRKLKTIFSWYYFFFLINLTLALAIVPTRMHGAVPFLIISDFLLTIFEQKKKFISRFLILRIFLPISIFALLSHFKSFGESSFTADRISESINSLNIFIQQGFHSVWFYFLGTLGHLTLPDNISLNSFSGVILLTSLISLLLGLVLSGPLFKVKKKAGRLSLIIFNLIWAVVLWWIASINPNPLAELNPYSASHVLFTIALGGQFIFWSIWTAYFTRRHYPDFSSAVIVSLVWIVTLSLVYWLFTPYYIIETTGRYMLMGAAGFSIFLGAFLNILFSISRDFSKAEKTKASGSLYLVIPGILLLFWLLVNFQKSQFYFGALEQTRNRTLTDRTWETLINSVPKLDTDGPSVFYFTTDNPLSLQGVLVFGFFMRAGMTYRIPNQDLTPLPSTDYQELLAYVKDGSPLQKVHARKAVPVPLSRIFAFDFRGGNLINITTSVREKLLEDSKRNKVK